MIAHTVNSNNNLNNAWQEIWDALFWRFLDIHRVFFLKNPRLGMLVKTFDKWDESKKKSVHHLAENYIGNLGLK